MQVPAIIGTSIAAAALDGVLHDQITVRLSLEYYTIAHPRLFASDSPTLHALGRSRSSARAASCR